jgi:glycosyltransferase involved in cell wall biosynthesis
MYKGKKIALVVPAYNEQRLIKPTLTHVPAVIDKVYVVDDGSRDKTAEVIKAIMRRDKRIMLIKHKKNMGLGQAIITGYKKSFEDKADITVVVGGDYQMDLSIASDKADYVKGNRFMEDEEVSKTMPFARVFGNSMLSLLTKFATGYWKVYDSNDGYTALRTEVIGKVDWSKATKGYGYNGDWMAMFNVKNVRIKDVPRKAIYLQGERQSQIKTFKYIRKVFPRLVWRFFWRLKRNYIIKDFHPLVLFYAMGFLLIPIGLISGLDLVWIRLNSRAISGNTVVLTALLLITGFQSILFAILFDMQMNEKLQP